MHGRCAGTRAGGDPCCSWVPADREFCYQHDGSPRRNLVAARHRNRDAPPPYATRGLRSYYEANYAQLDADARRRKLIRWLDNGGEAALRSVSG